MNKKIRILLLLFIIVVMFLFIIPTNAVFSDDYVTENDAVGLHLHFDLSMSHLEEYEEVRVPSNSYEVFQVNVFNSTGDNVYYGVWYQLVNLDSMSDDVVIARLEDNLTSMSGELGAYQDKTVSVIIKNRSVNDIIVNIGVNSSLESVQSIEYLGGKHLISDSAREVDYDYQNILKKYVSTFDSNQYFTLNGFRYSYQEGEQVFVADHSGSYLVEAWGAKSGDKKGGYVSGIIRLSEKEKLYFDVNERKSVVRYASSSENLDDIIMISSDERSYVSGHYGSLASSFYEDEMKEKCVTGMEDIACSYHISGKIFHSTKVLTGEDEFSSLDGKSKIVGNDGDGLVKVTPVVPFIEISDNTISFGQELDMSKISCVDGGNGCYIVKVMPSKISDLGIGEHDISFMVSDDDGFIYRYRYSFLVKE